MATCPSCQEWILNGSAMCDCGWREGKRSKAADPNHGKCAWISRGLRCDEQATTSPSTSEPEGTKSGQGTTVKWYCSWHYECLTRHREDDKLGRDYAEWKMREVEYDIKYKKRRGSSMPEAMPEDEYDISLDNPPF